MKTGTHPMRTKLRLFLDWGITFEEPYTVPERAGLVVSYASRIDLERNLPQSSKAENMAEKRVYSIPGHSGTAQDKNRKRGNRIKTHSEEEL